MSKYLAWHCVRYPLTLAMLCAGCTGDIGEGSAEPPDAPKKKLAPAEAWQKHWTAAERGMFTDHGQVFSREGEIHLTEGSPATGIRYQGAVPRREYEVYCQAKRTGGSDFFYGLTFPIGQDYCSLIVGGWGGTAVGLSNIDGLSAIENSTTQYMEFEKDRWYKIRLRVAGKKIGVWIDDKSIIDVSTEEHTFDIWWEQTPMRPLGIATWNTSAAIRHFKISHLKPQKKRENQEAASAKQTKGEPTE